MVHQSRLLRGFLTTGRRQGIWCNGLTKKGLLSAIDVHNGVEADRVRLAPAQDAAPLLPAHDPPFSLAGTTLIRGSLQPVPLAARSDQFVASCYNGRWPAETDLHFGSLGSHDLEDVLSDIAADVQDDWGQEPLFEDVERIWNDVI